MRPPFSTSDPCWFRYPASVHPSRVTSIVGSGPVVDTIVQELVHAGIATQPYRELVSGAELVLARRDVLDELVGQGSELRQLAEHRDHIAAVGAEGFAILSSGGTVVVTAADDSGLLYGFFHLLRLGDGPWQTPTALVSNPDHPLRMLNHWDNLSADDPLGLGSVERGYAGDSIFFRANTLVADTDRIVDYGRLLASVGINALSVNNVNVHPVEATLLTTRLPLVQQIADLLRPYGVKVYLSVNFASPMMLGGLSTADPAAAEVTDWWRTTTDQVYEQIPDFGGFVVKADSEGQPGPFTYGRGHAHGANMFATVLEPHGGVVFWRAFVYNHLQDWRDRRTDRARAAYDHFMPIDGAFADNVVLQIKNGPMDFQPREPVSPLLLGLERTNIALEVQLTQEYSGHQKHVGYLVPQWKDALDFGPSDGDQVPTVAQRLTSRPLSAICGVVNVGDSRYWTGHPLAQANLYGYGRLAWDNTLPPEQILAEWMRQTLGDDPTVTETVADIMLDSLVVYESYTAPLGVGWMVTPSLHYGPSVDGYEYSPWGNYHFADRDGVGVDRTSTTGTGYARQYPTAWADVYDGLDTCPDELLLFFHHVPYGHVLHSGSTVIQHIYDTHFAGVERVEQMRQQWAGLAGRVDPETFEEVTGRLDEQLRSAKEWRDQVNSYFYRKSGVSDAHGRDLY